MRVLIILPGGVHPSGTHYVIPALLSLIKRLASKHAVTVILTGQARWPHRFSLLGADIIDLGFARRRLLGTHLAQTSLIAGVVLRRTRADVVHAFWAGHEGMVAAIAGGSLGVPVVLTLAGGELVALDDIAYGGQRTLKSRMMIRGSLRLADVVTAGSREMIDRACTHRRSPEPRLIPLGVERESFYFERCEPKPRPGPLRLLHVASINRVKDPHTLLNAFAELVAVGKDVVLDWVGVDTLNGEVQRRAADVGVLARIRFHGLVDHRELKPLYEAADVYVHTSRHECQSVAILEAAMSGLPIVATRVGQVHELAPRAAIAVDVGNAHAVAEAISALMNDPEKMKVLGRAAQAFALAHDADWTANRFQEIYEELVDDR